LCYTPRTVTDTTTPFLTGSHGRTGRPWTHTHTAHYTPILPPPPTAPPFLHTTTQLFVVLPTHTTHLHRHTCLYTLHTHGRPTPCHTRRLCHPHPTLVIHTFTPPHITHTHTHTHWTFTFAPPPTPCTPAVTTTCTRTTSCRWTRTHPYFPGHIAVPHLGVLFTPHPHTPTPPPPPRDRFTQDVVPDPTQVDHVSELRPAPYPPHTHTCPRTHHLPRTGGTPTAPPASDTFAAWTTDSTALPFWPPPPPHPTPHGCWL